MSTTIFYTFSLYKSGKFSLVNTVSLLTLYCLLIALFAGCVGQQTTQQLKGTLKISGSTALQPLIQAVADAFEKKHPRVKIEVRGIGSSNGLKEVTQGKVDIGSSDIYADPTKYPDPRLTDHIIGAIPFTMIVNTSVNIKSLTKDQIIDIYSRNAITNWNQVNSALLDLKIVSVARPNTSGTRATFRKYVLEGRDELIGSKIAIKKDGSKEILETVASTPGAIGYIALSYLKNQKSSKVRQLLIDNQQPTVQGIESGKYEFWSYGHMYTLGEDNPIATAFLHYMTQKEAQDKAREIAYIPIEDLKIGTLARQGNAAGIQTFTLPTESDGVRRESI